MKVYRALEFSFSLKGNVTIFHLKKKKDFQTQMTKTAGKKKAIFKFLGGYHKQRREKNKLKFFKKWHLTLSFLPGCP